MAKKRKNQGKGGGKLSYDKLGDDDNHKQPTRSSSRKKSQKKKHSDAAADDYKLRNMVEADGLTIMDMNADGNCLFRALSDQLYGDMGNNHDIVRSEICDFMEDNQDDFKVFLVFDDDGEEEEDAKDFESYVSSMRQDGDWGGNLELVAAARLYRRKITVFSATLAAFTIDHDGSEPSGPDLLVSFHDNDHYNSVRDEKAPPKPASKRTNTKSKPKTPTPKPPTPKPPNPAERGMYVECVETAEKLGSHPKGSTKVNPSVNDSMSELTVKDTAEATMEIKPPKKNDPCPCGSGQRFKKCCLAKQKHAKRVEAMKAKNPTDAETSDTQEEVTMKGNFRVLQI